MLRSDSPRSLQRSDTGEPKRLNSVVAKLVVVKG